MPKRMPPEDFVHRVELLYNKEYDVLENYITANIKIKIKHCTCGRVFLTRPADFLRGHGCPYCGGTKKKDNEYEKV